MLQFFLHRAAAAVTAAATLAGSGSLTATATRTTPAAATLSGTGSLSATASRTAFASATLAGSGSLSATPATDVLIIDDGDAGFATVGTWTTVGIAGYQSDYRYIAAGSGSNTATWTFTGLASGTYRVSVTWVSNANRATDAPFTVYDDSTALGTVDINQESLPSTLEDAGVWWDHLGEYAISSGTLKVVLTDDANEFVIADAVRVEFLSAPTTLTGAASLSGSGSLVAAATRTAFIAASLGGSGSLSATADIQGVQTAAASLSGSGSLTATAQQTHFASVSLSGVGTLSAVTDGMDEGTGPTLFRADLAAGEWAGAELASEAWAGAELVDESSV